MVPPTSTISPGTSSVAGSIEKQPTGFTQWQYTNQLNIWVYNRTYMINNLIRLLGINVLWHLPVEIFVSLALFMDMEDGTTMVIGPWTRGN